MTNALGPTLLYTGLHRMWSELELDAREGRSCLVALQGVEEIVEEFVQ